MNDFCCLEGILELRHLRYFKVVAEMEHFRKAAEVLCITQPALSNQIKQLEEELKTKLFYRVGRRVKLSESGELALSSTKKILNEVSLLKEIISDVEVGEIGSLKVGVLQSINALYLRDLIIKFDNKYPLISLHIEEMTNDEIERKVASGDIDIGIGFKLNRTDLNIKFEELFKENWKLVLHGSQSHLASTILNGCQHHLKAILFPQQFETRKVINKYFIENHIHHAAITEVNSISSILDLVENSESFTILPEAFSAIKSNHNLALFDLNPALKPRTIGFLIPHEKMLKQSTQNFCKLTREQRLNQSP